MAQHGPGSFVAARAHRRLAAEIKVAHIGNSLSNFLAFWALTLSKYGDNDKGIFDADRHFLAGPPFSRGKTPHHYWTLE
jgi:hypothetical protein